MGTRFLLERDVYKREVYISIFLTDQIESMTILHQFEPNKMYSVFGVFTGGHWSFNLKKRLLFEARLLIAWFNNAFSH